MRRPLWCVPRALVAVLAVSLAGADVLVLKDGRKVSGDVREKKETLAIRVWATTGEGFYTRAGAAALVLLAVSALAFAAFAAAVGKQPWIPMD